MTSAVVGAAARGAAAKGGGSSFQGAKAMGIERPPPGHFDTPAVAEPAPAPAPAAPSTSDSPQSTAPKKATPAKKSTPAKKKAPKDNTQGLSGEKPAPDSGGLNIGPPQMPTPQVPSVVNTGAGFLLGLMFWTWVALPFLNNGGVTGVKNQLRAKFLNKAPDGSWLP